MEVSEHFTLEELTKSPTAVRLGIDNSADAAVQDKLDALCANVLEPVRRLYGKPIIVSSGYRCEALNKAVGGAAKSQHLLGEAVDIHSVQDTREENKKLYKAILESKVEFDQLINEYNYDWIHVSFRAGHNRTQTLDIV